MAPGADSTNQPASPCTPPIELTFPGALYSTLAKLFVLMPFFSSITIVGFYFLPFRPGWVSIAYGVGLTFCLWVVVSIFWTWMWCLSVHLPVHLPRRKKGAGSDPPQGNNYSPKAIPNMISRLSCRIEQVEGYINNISPNNSLFQDSTSFEVIKTRIDSYMEDARKLLQKTRLGPLWVAGKDELAVIRLLHRAEENLYLIDSPAMLVDRAVADYFLIKSTHFMSQDYLIKLLRSGLACLNPSAVHLLAEAEPEEHLEYLLKGSVAEQTHSLLHLRIEEQFEHLLKGSVAEQTPDAFHLVQEKREASPVYEKTPAISVLSKVKKFFNDYRDGGCESIVHLRDQLVRGLTAVGLITFVLVSLVISTMNDWKGVKLEDARSMFLAGVTFYIIGAMAGLFGRFFGESDRGELHPDYDLSLARLVATPLFSGLAGIVGVVIALSLGGVFASGGVFAPGASKSVTNTLAEIFQFKPLNLLTAAAFGLTPNLVMQKLKVRTKEAEEEEKGKSELQSLGAGGHI